MNSTNARIIHLAMSASAVILMVVFAGLRFATSWQPLGASMVWWVVAAAQVGLLVLVVTFVGRGLPRFTGGDPEVWWRANAPRVLVLWGAAEGAAIVGVVLWMLSGDHLLFALVAVPAIAVLGTHGPSQLLER